MLLPIGIRQHSGPLGPRNGRFTCCRCASGCPALRFPYFHKTTTLSWTLQEVVDEAHERGRYDRTDYGQPPEPPLSPDAAA